MWKIEGLHNHTGRWITLVDGIPRDAQEEAQEQIDDFAKGGNSHAVLWGVPTNRDHFSAFRLT